MNCSVAKIPQLRSAAQFGGGYVQVVPFGHWVVASRIGGLQVFSDDDRLLPVDECALAVIPDIRESEGALFAICRTTSFEISVNEQGRISLKNTAWGWRPRNGSSPYHELETQFGRFFINKAEGSVSTPSDENLKLPGYSRPSWISCNESRGVAYIADVGCIHRLVLRDRGWVLDGSYECAGWPKDVACVNDNVFVANVLGVSWYKKVGTYPFLRLWDRVSHFHFRIAKVIASELEVFVCDEARGVHVFSFAEGRLKASGGVFVPGGGWDFLPCGRSGYLASGSDGWRWYEDFRLFVSGGKSRMEHHKALSGERVQGIVNWEFLDSVAIMTSRACRVLKGHSDSIVFEHQCNAWGGVAVDNYLVVATESGLILLHWNPESQRIAMSDFIQFEEARDISWDGSFFWVASGLRGVLCFALDKEKQKLRFVGCFPVCGFVRGVCRTVDRLYVGAGDGGLVVLKT